jgi:hypothetical protein
MEQNATQIDRHVVIGERLQKEGNMLGALVAFRQAYDLTQTGSPRQATLQKRIRDLEQMTGTLPAGGAVPPDAETIYAPSGGLSRNQPVSFSTNGPANVPTHEWHPVMVPTSRTPLFWRLLAIFAGVAVVLFVVILAASENINAMNRALSAEGSNVGLQTISSTILAGVVGAIQIWAFKYRIRGKRRGLFLVTTAVGGLVGGLLGGIFMDEGLVTSSAVGAVIGLTAGFVASIGQNFLLRNRSAALKWFLYNTLGWLVIWGLGWSLSWKIGGPLGLASSAAVIMILSGLEILIFLYFSPEIEF